MIKTTNVVLIDMIPETYFNQLFCGCHGNYLDAVLTATRKDYVAEK